MFLHGTKIAVVVQQKVPVFDGVGADYDIGGLADRDAEPAQRATVSGSSRGKVRVQERHHGKLTKAALDTRSMYVVSRSLEEFEQSEITDQKRLSASRFFQLDSCRCPMAAQMRDPDGAVDKDHERAGARS